MREEKRMNQIGIYVADIRPLAEEEIFRQQMELLPMERQERIRRYRSPGDRQRGLGAGLLLEYGLRDRGYSLLEAVPGKKQVRLDWGAYGKPYIPETERLHFNLSHAGEYAAAVFAPCAAGIDIEQIRAAGFAVAKRFFTKEECAYLDRYKDAGTGSVEPRRKGRDWEKDPHLTDADSVFTAMWTRKESYIKAVGEGMHLPLADFSVLEDRILEKEEYYLRTWGEPEGYMLSVCARMPVEAEVIPVLLTEGIWSRSSAESI